MAVLFLALLFRNTGLYPVVFGDEWSYSSFSRLISLAHAPVPSYLYLYLYKKTSLCGDGFLDCARILNSTLYIAAIPLIYLIARRVCSAKVAVFVGIFSAAGALNTYTAYFMPEAMYFLVFWIMSWATIALLGHTPSLRHALFSGACLGLMALVKVHALFLIPGLLVFIALTLRGAPHQRLGNKPLLTGGAFILAALSIKWIGGFAAAGKAGLTMFGNLYGSQASSVINWDRYVQIGLQTGTSLQGQVMALSLLFGLPMAVLLLFVQHDLRRPTIGITAHERESRNVRLYTLCTLVPLLLVTAAFTASVAGSGPYESIGRLHMRYYNFALPLLLIVAAAELPALTDSRVKATSLASAGLVVVVAGYSLWCFLAPYTPSMVDSPELRGITSTPQIFYGFGALGLLATLVWVFNRRWGACLFVFVFTPLTAITSTYQVSAEILQRRTPDAYDDAGIFTRKYLGTATSALVIVAPAPAAALRTLFHIDNVNAATYTAEEGSLLESSHFPTTTEWLLLIGNYDFRGSVHHRLSLPGFSLVRIAREDVFDFRRSLWPGIIARAHGLSKPESWGTWTDGHEASFEFIDELPQNFLLELKGHLFKPAARQNITVTVGNDTQKLLLGSTPAQTSLTFSTDGHQRILKINVPNPASPKSQGMSDDVRQLGVALDTMKITPLPSPVK